MKIIRAGSQRWVTVNVGSGDDAGTIRVLVRQLGYAEFAQHRQTCLQAEATARAGRIAEAKAVAGDRWPEVVEAAREAATAVARDRGEPAPGPDEIVSLAVAMLLGYRSPVADPAVRAAYEALVAAAVVSHELPPDADGQPIPFTADSPTEYINLRVGTVTLLEYIVGAVLRANMLSDDEKKTSPSPSGSPTAANGGAAGTPTTAATATQPNSEGEAAPALG